MKAMIFSILLFFQAANIMAVELREHRGGEVLIFPFFNVEQGWDSLLTISTSAQSNGRFFQRDAAIFKIRIREAVNGQLVKSFTVYNTSIFNWRASLSKNATEQTTLKIAEGDCVISDTNEVFEGEGTEIQFTATTGIIEVYSIGRIDRLFDSSGSPLTCSDFANNWKPEGRWNLDSADGISQSPPLTGELILVNAAQGLATSYVATALGHFTDKKLHSAPDNDFPTLADAEAVVTLPNGETIIPESEQGIDAVATVLGLGEQELLSNDVNVLDGIGARTDWIISYPLAGYKTYRPYSVEINSVIRHCEAFKGAPTEDGDPTVKVASVEYWINSLVSDGENQRIGGEDVLLDPPPPIDSGVNFCYAVNIMSFEGMPSNLLAQDADILSDLSHYTASPNSSLTWKLIEPIFPTDSGIRRPVQAFSLTTFVNGTLNGGRTLANYAILRPHRRE